MARGLGKGGRPLGSRDEQPSDNQPQYTAKQIEAHNKAIKVINYYRSHYCPETDHHIRVASADLIHGSMTPIEVE